MGIIADQETKKRANGKARSDNGQIGAWADHSDELTRWAYTSLYARDDAYPAWSKRTNDWRCVHEDLTKAVARDHFHGRQTIGTYTLGRDSTCLWVGWDIDRHDGDPGDPEANRRYAFMLFKRLVRMGANPLLEDSNGSGGFHVWLRFADRIPGSLAYSVAAWLVTHCPKKIHVEAFPKQPDLNETRRYGNQMRLPGKHHKRNHWSRFWDGEKWLAGDEACRWLLDFRATDVSVFPQRAREYVAPTFPKKPTSDTTPTAMNQDEAVLQARRYLAKVPGTRSGQGQARQRACRLAMFVVHGFALPTGTATEVLTEWGERLDQTDEHGSYYPWSEKDCINLVQWAEGQEYSGVRGDKVRLTGHELDDAIEEEIEKWAAGKRQAATETPPASETHVASESVPKPSRNGQQTAQETGRATAEQERKMPAWTHGISAADLDAEDIQVEYLVDRLLAAMPTVIGGRFKTLKTLIMLDLLVSMSSGTRFLNKWKCKKVKVGVWSGESGRLAVQNAMRRICKARGIRMSDCELDLHFTLPPLYSRTDLDLMARLIVIEGYKAVFIDPAYLCLLDSQTAARAGNVFVMGAALQPLTEVGQATGCLVGLVHHFGKWTDSNNFTPAELGELSQAGMAEWPRQWLLLSRRAPYQHDGKHLLYMTAGGSLGQSWQVGIDVDEGDLSDVGLRTKWQVEVKNIVQAQAADKIAKIEKKQALKEQREATTEEAVVKVLETLPDGETARELSRRVGRNMDTLAAALNNLVKSGQVEKCKIKKNTASYDAYKLAGKGAGATDATP
jgi:hypothetical protein